MKVLVTGGSGFLGINLIRQLLQQGHEVRSYDLMPFHYPEATDVEELRGDIRDLGLHDRAFAGVDAVVHCAAALPLCSPDEIMSTDVIGTRRLLQSAARSGVDRFVFISSTAVYGVPDHHPLYESDAMVGVGPYGEAKIAAERVCAEFRDQGMCLPVIRPKSFVGPERLGAFELLYDFAYEGHGFPVLGQGDNLYQLLDVADLCNAVSLCLTGEGDLVNDTFNVGAMTFGTMRESFQAVLDAAGHGKRVVSFPAGPSIALLRMLEAMKLSPLYAWIYETAGKESYVSVEKIGQKLGFSPRYSNVDALVRNYRWYVENRDRIPRGAGVTHREPWKRGALRLLKYVL